MNSSNFQFLGQHEPLLLQLAKTAEQAFYPDPNTTLLKLRQLGEALAQEVAFSIGCDFQKGNTQIELLTAIQAEAKPPKEVLSAFHIVRKLGNLAAHTFSSSHEDALRSLKTARTLCIWFHRALGDPPRGWRPGPFRKPEDPDQLVRSLQAQLQRLEKAHRESQRQLAKTHQLAEERAKKNNQLSTLTNTIREEAEVWQSLAEEREAAYLAAKTHFENSIGIGEALFNMASGSTELAKEAISKTHWEEFGEIPIDFIRTTRRPR